MRTNRQILFGATAGNLSDGVCQVRNLISYAGQLNQLTRIYANMPELGPILTDTPRITTSTRPRYHAIFSIYAVRMPLNFVVD